MKFAHDSSLHPSIRIRSPLRCDGVGRLDWAEDAASGERLAVRWMPMAANGQGAAKACERLPRHPILPRVVQTGHVGASAFVAMDFPEGELLSALVQGGQALEFDVVLRLAARLASALAALHEQGLVHGELSLDSVLLAPEDRVFLWDLPLVLANRHSDRRGERRDLLALVKTAAFLAPERARGGPPSTASDVHALGALLCATAGDAPPAGESTLGLVHLVASGGWAPRVPAKVGEPWRTLVQRMVAPEAVDRPTASEVAWALRTLVPGGPLETLPAVVVEALTPAEADAHQGPLVEATLVKTAQPPPLPARPPPLPARPPPLPTRPLSLLPARPVSLLVEPPPPLPARASAPHSWGVLAGGTASAALLLALATYFTLSAVFPDVVLFEEPLAPLAGTVTRPPRPPGAKLDPLPGGLRRDRTPSPRP